MPTALEDVKAKALELSVTDRNELIRVLLDTIDGEPEDTQDAIARAWDDEIARRLDDLDAGRTQTVPAEEVVARISAKLRKAGA